MRILLLFFWFFPAIALAQTSSVTGDFDGDGKKETATFVIEQESYREGGYDPLFIPGVYSIKFNTSKISTISLGSFTGGLFVKNDFTKNGKDELLIIGGNEEIPPIGRTFYIMECSDGTMHRLISGIVPPLIPSPYASDSMLLTVEDTVYLLSQPDLYNVNDMFVIHARKIFPEEEELANLITKQHKLYPYVKNFVVDSAIFNYKIYESALIDTLPQFPGGDDLRKSFVAKNLRYPEMARDYGIEGVVLFSFVVGKDGSISDITILKSPHKILDDEVKRLYQSMPKWEPGIENGKRVRVKMTDRINFKQN